VTTIPTWPANSTVATWQAAGEALLRSAEHDGDFVCSQEAEPPAREGQDHYHGREQRSIGEYAPDELGPGVRRARAGGGVG